MDVTQALTVREACQQLRISKPTALKLLKSGDIPGVRFGKSWRIGKEALENLMRGGSSGQKQGKPKIPKAL